MSVLASLDCAPISLRDQLDFASILLRFTQIALDQFDFTSIELRFRVELT